MKEQTEKGPFEGSKWPMLLMVELGSKYRSPLYSYTQSHF